MLETTGPTKPEFLIAGVQKSGTTALAHFLRQHNNIFLSSIKELHYFDHGTDEEWLNKDHSKYENAFSQKSTAQIAGEMTPIYTYWPKCLERIRQYNEKIKLITILRNPAERAYSHWRMETSRNREILPFSEAIRSGRRRVTDDKMSLEGHHRVYSYVERGFYSLQAERLLRFFPAEQVLFLKHDDMITGLDHFLDVICMFLKVPVFKTHPPNRVIRPVKHIADLPPLSLEDSQYLLNLYREDIAKTQTITGLDLSNWHLQN